MDIRKKCQPHLWLLTGTGEGHVFAKSLLKEGWKITVSVVSERASIPYEKLNKDRSWILEQLDRGSWPEFRPDLAALERELGQLLIRATEYIEENC